MAHFLDMDMAIVDKDPATGQFKATPYFETLMYEIISSLGGEGAPPVTDIETKEVSTHALSVTTKAIQHRVDELENEVTLRDPLLREVDDRTATFYTRIETTNYTAKNKDYVEGRKGITIKFPENPIRDHEVIFANGDGSSITFDGNGKNVKYTSTDTTFVTRKKGSSYHFHFFEDNDLNERYWRVR